MRRIRIATRVLALVLMGGAGLLAYSGAQLGTLFIPRARTRQGVRARLGGVLLRVWLTRLGATFVKIGQILSTRPDVLPPETIEKLRVLQDRVPPFPYQQAREIVESDLGAPLTAHFRVFGTVPVASGSVAQVHRAELHDGTPVAVKVLRPGIREEIERDRAILEALAGLAMVHPMARLSGMRAHVEELMSGVLEQTDLAREASNYERLHRNFRDVRGVIVPRVFRDQSSRRVLTMSFVEGVKIDQIVDGLSADLARLVRHSFFKMCFEDGFVHSDLHPGNLLVTPAGDLAILDAGLVKDMGDDFLHEFMSFTRCLILGTPGDFVAHFRRFHPYLGDTDWAALERDVGQLMERFQSQPIAQMETSEFSNEVFAFFRKHRIRPVPQITLVLVGSLSSEGIGKSMDPQADVLRELSAFLIGVLLRGLATGSASEPVLLEQ